MKFYKMLLALLLATTAMCLCTENSFAAELIQDTAVPDVLSIPAEISNTIPDVATTVADEIIPTTEAQVISQPAIVPVVESDLTQGTETAILPIEDAALLQVVDPELLQVIDPALLQVAETGLLPIEDQASLEACNTQPAKKTKKLSAVIKEEKNKAAASSNDVNNKLENAQLDSEELAKLAKNMEARARYSTDDVMLVAKLISHEAKGQSSEGMAAIAEVVINRINTPIYPNTIKDVIYQRGQFSHVRGVKKEKPTVEMIIIADLVLNYDYRVLNDPAVVNFRNPKKTSGFSANIRKNWGHLEYFTCIDDHAFYADRNVASASYEIPDDIKHNLLMAGKINVASNK